LKDLNYKYRAVKKPWGHYNVIKETSLYKEKIITIYQNQRISLQKHEKRNELWKIKQGLAEVTLNNKKFNLAKNEELFIPKQSIHRIKNIGKDYLIIKEIQTGEYFGEDDIIRIEDDYGRV
jgi:mannose-6-phosphate isomerase-like protein (cupin superfamily)